MKRDPRDDSLEHMDKQHVWHPFTPMKQWLADRATIIESGEGFELIDTQGRRYIDGFSSLWCNLHGHRVRQIDQAIKGQLGRIAHSTLLGFASGPSIELARRLVEIAPAGPPGLTKVFFSDCGSSAVEVALKMAVGYFQNIRQPSRRKFIAFREAYHGDTIGSISVGGIDLFHEAFRPLLFDTTFVDCPNAFYHPAGPQAGSAVLAEIEAILATRGHEYAGVVVEPLIQAAAGMLTHPSGFLRELRRMAQAHGLLLIADEVATGFARTGTVFACQQEAVCPDLLCVGKALTGGYLPVSATLASAAIFDSFCDDRGAGGYAGRAFFHGHTFSGNALGCAAAVASIDLMHSSRMLESVGEKIAMIRRHLAPLANHPHVGDIRQCGMMVGIDLLADRASKTAFDAGLRVGSGVCRMAMNHGVIIRPLGDVVVLMPAAGMDAATLQRVLLAVTDSIHEYFEHLEKGRV